MNAVGVDGWRGRWVAAAIDAGAIGWRVHDTFADVLGSYPDATIAVDMPVAVTEGPRASDVAAREWLRAHGGPWQSIFLTPTAETVRACAAGLSHAEAMAARAAGTPGTSIQAWNLIPQMLQVLQARRAHPAAAVHEAHPECSFRLLGELAGVEIGAASKKTGRGAGLRLRALHSVVELDLADAPGEVPVDDLLDACAVAWTAGRVLRDEHLRLPPAGADPVIAV
jgi:predicted RNase H-like nuclease